MTCIWTFRSNTSHNDSGDATVENALMSQLKRWVSHSAESYHLILRECTRPRCNQKIDVFNICATYSPFLDRSLKWPTFRFYQIWMCFEWYVIFFVHREVYDYLIVGIRHENSSRNNLGRVVVFKYRILSRTGIKWQNCI